MLIFYLNWLKFDIFYITCFPTHCRTSQLAVVSYNMIFYLKILRGCICDNLKPSFLPRLLFSWCTFSSGELQHVGYVGEQKIQELTNQN